MKILSPNYNHWPIYQNCESFCSGFCQSPIHKMQAVIDRQKGGHGPRRSMRRSWKLGTRSRHVACSSWQKCGVLRRKFGQESRLIRLSHIQRCRSFSERVGPRIMLLESEPGKESSRSKRSREIMHQSFETPAPPHSGLRGRLRGLSPQVHSILVPR